MAAAVAAGPGSYAQPMSVYPDVVGAETISSVTGCSLSFRTVRRSGGATRTNVPLGAGCSSPSITITASPSRTTKTSSWSRSISLCSGIE